MQEPADNHEILNAYKYVRPGNGFELARGGTVFGKIEVNGSKGHPLFTFLKNACPQPMKTIGSKDMLFYDTINVNDITWNFEKFLLDKKGRPRYRFSPAASYALVEKYLMELMAE